MADKSADEELQDVLTVVIDARNGYREAAKDTQRQGLAAFFASMVALKDRHANELMGLLRNRGVSPDENGSFLTTVNKAIFSIRSVFGGVDENVLPGLIDGETRIVGYYDDAIVAATDPVEKEALAKQRAELDMMIVTMRGMQTTA